MISRAPSGIFIRYGRFLVIGIVALFVDVGVYAALTRGAGIYYIAARVVSLCLSVIWSYSANRAWTFRARTPFYHKSLWRYLLVNGTSMLLNLGGLYVAVQYLNLPDIPSLIVISGLVSALSFLGHQYWTFAHREVSDQRSP